ncbi:MAG: SDR family oxidoreductase [Pseudomonadota bacterium]
MDEYLRREPSSLSNHLVDKVVVVTGAANGFGKLVCARAAQLGARVVATDINAEDLQAGVAELNAADGQAMAVHTDVTELAQMQAMVAEVVAKFGRVDVMINNAGTMPLAFYADHAEAAAAWDRCIDINFKGVLHGIVAVHDQMLQQGRGHIVNLSSIYGNFPVVGAAVYGATKAAVNFLSESLRMESQGKIKVTTIKPTGVPNTGLAGGIVNAEAIVGILGVHAASYGQLMQAHQSGELPAEYTDAQHIEYYALEPEHLAEQIIYAINQPWGVSISEVTVRASGDGYIL